MAVLSPRFSSRSGPTALLAAERELAPAWLRRFTGDDGAEPVVARDLFHRVLVTLATDRGEHTLTDAAHALGVLRAQQGHGAATVIEDVLALRSFLWGRVAILAEAPDDPAELMLVHERIVTVIEQVLRDVADAYVEETARTLAAQAYRDPLTGLVNRAGFGEAAEHELAMAGRTSAPALLLVDLDGFKQVNDTAGHLAGDRVLVGVARLLEQAARDADIVARLGGDEFAVLMSQTDAAKAEHLAERLLSLAAADERLAWSGGRVGLSIGVASGAETRTPEELVALADAAMYRAKRSGGGRVNVSDAAPEEEPVATRPAQRPSRMPGVRRRWR